MSRLHLRESYEPWDFYGYCSHFLRVAAVDRIANLPGSETCFALSYSQRLQMLS